MYVSLTIWRNPDGDDINAALLVRQHQGKHILLGADAK